MTSDSLMPFYGTNGTSSGFKYLDPKSVIEQTMKQIPVRQAALMVAKSGTPSALPADFLETESTFMILIDMPGHAPDSIDLHVENQVLTVRSERPRHREDVADGDSTGSATTVRRAERQHGIFSRSFVLPSAINNDGIEANLDQGVLTVTLPKREEAKARSIEVKVGA